MSDPTPAAPTRPASPPHDPTTDTASPKVQDPVKQALREVLRVADTASAPKGPAPVTLGEEKDASKPEADKEAAKPKTDRDPIVDLVQRLQGASLVLTERDAGLARGINQLAERSAEPGRTSEAQFRTQVAYSLQDMEKVVGAGRIAMPADLRSEMTQLAATAPGLENRQMQALVRNTPEIEDRALVRDVRRAATIIGGLGSDQNSQGVREQVEVLENRVRLAARATPMDATPATPAQRQSAGVQPEAGEGTPIRAQASPGDSYRDRPAERSADHQGAIDNASKRPAADPQPKSVMAGVLNAMRSPSLSSAPPWNPPPVSMGDRISKFEERLAQGKTDQLIRASEKSGVAYMTAVERFAAGPGAGILGKIDAAAGADAGGVKAVMGEMKPGGRYANLRSEFDDALQKDRVFAASYSQVERTGSQYGRDRLALAGDFEAKKLNVSQLGARFQKADEAIGEATSKIPGRTPGKSAMEELGEKVAELLSKAVDRVKTMFGRDAVPEQRASAGPGMSP